MPKGVQHMIQIGAKTLLSLRKFRRFCFYDLGFRTYAALLNNKRKQWIVWIDYDYFILLFLNPCLFFKRFEIFYIWSKLALDIFRKRKKIGPRLLHGMSQSVQGGTPQKFRKTGRKQNAPQRESIKQPAPNGSRFLGWIFDGFQMVLGSI